ncbi:MAG: flagellar filament capping protein FliD [Oscillospiraceae bacterium]|nr:flagellar filament capping protein FliD [Oscillospiraceae bacterium]
MANINSLMSSTSSTTSLYGTRNVLSGLASGMDTEAMIENSVSGYKTKITQLEKEQTKYQWKQDAYRSITDKMYDLTQKYTSYTSKTNLYSNAFFNNSISTETVGNTDAVSKISATGRSSSDIQILAAQAATAATYSVSANNLNLNGSNTTTSDMNLDDNITVGTLKGTMTLNYDGQKIDLDFDETDLIGNGTGDTKTLAAAIQEKLEKATINTSYGTKKASEVIGVDASSGSINFTDLGNRGASPYISSIGSDLASKLGATSSELYTNSGTKKYTIPNNSTANFTEDKTIAQYLSGKDINVTVDGVTKSFRLKESDLNTNNINDVVNAFQRELNNVGANITVQEDSNTPGQLTFTTNNASSNFSISTKDSKANELFGFGDGISNYLSDKSSIETLLGNSFTFTQTAETDTTITGRLEAEGGYFRDKTTGNLYEKDNTSGNYYRVSDDNNHKPLYELKINNKSIYVAKDASLESVLEGINNSDMGVKASYSKLSGKFVFTAKETGASGNIRFDNALAQRLFTQNAEGTATSGKDAAVRALVNGELVTLQRSSNTIDMDGMSVTLKGSFNEDKITWDANNNVDSTQPNYDSATEKANAVSFKTSGGSDDLVKTITGFVDEYNALLKELHDAYATQPAEKSAKNHTRYEPLTDDDKKDMSDKAIESYEAKAKQGLLFGDSDLRAAYESLVQAISPGGNDGAALRNMGIETTYSGGLTQIKLDESKLRETLEKDPDSVRNAFTKSKESGASTDGLMTSIKNTLERYGSTSYSSPGILVKKAGSTYNSSSLLNNDMQKQLDTVQKKIEQWQTKMGTKIDYYTRASLPRWKSS